MRKQEEEPFVSEQQHPLDEKYKDWFTSDWSRLGSLQNLDSAPRKISKRGQDRTVRKEGFREEEEDMFLPLDIKPKIAYVQFGVETYSPKDCEILLLMLYRCAKKRGQPTLDGRGKGLAKIGSVTV